MTKIYVVAASGQSSSFERLDLTEISSVVLKREDAADAGIRGPLDFLRHVELSLRVKKSECRTPGLGFMDSMESRRFRLCVVDRAAAHPCRWAGS